MRDRHQEVALHLLDLGKAGRHLAESLAQMTELARRVLRNFDVVLAARDRVGRVGQLQDGPHDPVRQVRGQERGDEEAQNARDCEPLDQVVDACADVRLLRRDNNRPERRGRRGLPVTIGFATA